MSFSDSYCLAAIALQRDAPQDTIKTNLNPIRQTYPFENWYARQAIERGQYRRLSYTYNDAVLFGYTPIYQQHIGEDLVAIYQDIAELLQAEHYVLLRAWHYLPQLSQAADYQIFCNARAQAFTALKPNCYCAATVIGTDSDCGVVYFIATRKAGITVNNPRQTLPHLYPKHYVEPAPMFARATLKQWGSDYHLYISGTAAIVGHASLHKGDADAQLGEVLHNVETLLDEASQSSKMQLKNLQHIKLYADKSVADDITPLVDKYLARQTSLQIFEGQMCRPELLVEMEAMVVSDMVVSDMIISDKA